MKTIYILHGWAISSENELKWEKFRNLLQSKNVNSVFLKIPGLDTDLENPWNLLDYVDWLQNELPNDKEVILLGHSFGGQLATRFTATNPSRVSKLILIDSSGIIDKSYTKQLKRKFFFLLAKLGKLFTKSELLRKLLYKIAREKDYYSANSVMKKTMQNVISEEILEDLPKLKVPTLILWGEHDRATPLKFARELLSGIADSRLKIILGARHAPQFTHYQQVVEQIENFLKDSE